MWIYKLVGFAAFPAVQVNSRFDHTLRKASKQCCDFALWLVEEHFPCKFSANDSFVLSNFCEIELFRAVIAD